MKRDMKKVVMGGSRCYTSASGTSTQISGSRNTVLYSKNRCENRNVEKALSDMY